VKKIYLAIGIHNHQPVGNFEFVFKEAYKKAYLPFFERHEKHPSIKLAQHYSGELFRWILEHDPDFGKRLNAMTENGAIEMLSGGFYEPVLSSIPDKDKVGQIEMLNSFVQDKTGFRPEGMWLAERVWEPVLASAIAKAGMKYTIIDDSHFKYAGLQEDDLTSYFVTEDNGAVVNIFPISERLRYLIPFRPAQQTIDYLRSLATEDGDRLVVFADDGEKFGIWPGTHKQCYQDGWLDEFFRLLEENSDWIHIISFREALQQIKPAGRVYLPTASYSEMMEWALPTGAQKEYEDFQHWLENHDAPSKFSVYVRGGFWRNFMAKYPESNNLHKRMLRATQRAEKLSGRKGIQNAIDDIYAGQTNCPYWHGVFGGLYLPHLRAAIYKKLIHADTIMDELEFSEKKRQSGWLKTETTDFDADGLDEVVVETDRMNLFFSPQDGGSLFELDIKSKNVNLIDTMTRREEAYHKKLYELRDQDGEHGNVASIHERIEAKEKGLEKYLNYDWYRRTSFLDHFLRDDTTLKTFRNVQYGEQGDFVNQPFEVHRKKEGIKQLVTFERAGNVWIGDHFTPVLLSKTFAIQPKSDEIEIKYSLKNTNHHSLQVWFGFEMVFSLLAGDAPDRYYMMNGKKVQNPKLASTASSKNVNNVSLTDEWLGLHINIDLDKKAALWRFPIETISMSEGGFERVYQGSVIMPHWRISLEPENEWSVMIRKSINVRG